MTVTNHAAIASTYSLLYSASHFFDKPHRRLCCFFAVFSYSTAFLSKRILIFFLSLFYTLHVVPFFLEMGARNHILRVTLASFCASPFWYPSILHHYQNTYFIFMFLLSKSIPFSILFSCYEAWSRRWPWSTSRQMGLCTIVWVSGHKILGKGNRSKRIQVLW